MSLSRLGGHGRKIFTAVAMAAFVAVGPQAHAALTVTAAGTAEGLSLSTFATGFPNQNSIGPLGVAFTSTGGVLVSTDSGNVYNLPADTDGQVAGAGNLAASFGFQNAFGMAQVSSNIYMAQYNIGQVVQLNQNGTLNQVIVNGLSPIALAADAANGHLFASNATGIFDIDPVAKTKTLFNLQNADGVGVSNDGSTLYAEIGSHIFGFNTTTKLQTFDSGLIAGNADGMAVGSGSLAGKLFVNTNSGSIVQVDIATLAQTVIAIGGSRGDFVTVDPNGTLLLTQTDSIVRLAAAGGGFGNNGTGGTGGTGTPLPAGFGPGLATALLAAAMVVARKRAQA